MKRFFSVRCLLFVPLFFSFEVNASHKKASIKKKLQSKLQMNKQPDLLTQSGGPAQFAVMISDAQALDAALKLGADVNAKFPDGDSLYQKAIFCLGHAKDIKDQKRIIAYNEMIKILQNAGANDAKASKENMQAHAQVKDANVSAHAQAAAMPTNQAADQKAKSEDQQAEIKQKKEKFSEDQKRDIFIAINRIDRASNVITALKEKKVSDVQLVFAGKNLKRCLEHYALVMKKMGMTLDQVLFFLNLSSKDLFERQYCEMLLHMNPTLDKTKIKSNAAHYFKQMMNKIYSNSDLSKSIQTVDNLILAIGDNSSDNIMEVIGTIVEVSQVLGENDAKLQAEVIERYQSIQRAYSDIDSSQEEFLTVVKNVLDTHIDSMNQSLRLIDNINSFDKYGYSPLCYAVLNDNAELVKALIINQKANPNMRDQYGRCPLLFAWSSEVKKVLKEHGARIDFQDEQGKTALMDACEKGADTVVKALLIEEANFRLEDKVGKTAYELATPTMRIVLDEKFKDAPGKLYAERENQRALELKKKTEQDKTQELTVNPAELAHKEAARQEKNDRKKARRQQREKEKEEDNKKLLPLNIKSISFLVQQRIRAKAFEQLKKFVKSQKDAEFLALESDPDICLRRRALQEAIVLYENAHGSDAKVHHELLDAYRNNMEDASLRFVEYYKQKYIKPQLLFAQLKDKCARHGDESVCGHDLMVDVYENLQALEAVQGEYSEFDLFNRYYDQSSLKNVDHAARELVDAIRANDTAIVDAILNDKAIDHRKMQAPLIYARLHNRNEIADKLTRYSMQKPDAKMVAEHLARVNATIEAKKLQLAQAHK